MLPVISPVCLKLGVTCPEPEYVTSDFACALLVTIWEEATNELLFTDQVAFFGVAL